VLSFGKDFSVVETTENEIIIETPLKGIILKDLQQGLYKAIHVLGNEGATEDALANIVIKMDGESALAGYYNYLQKFIKHQMINFSVMGDDTCLATLIPASPNFGFVPKQAESGQQYVLSRFAYCHREKGRIVLESPLAHGKIELKNWMAAVIITELSKAVTITDLSATFANISEDTITLFISLLLSADFITEFKQDQTYPDGDEVLAQWEFHDLLFHSRSRLGRHTNRFGGTYRFYNKIEPLPAVKPQMSEDVIDLYRPDLDQLEQDDYPFTMVLEHRQSIREYADQPLTDKQLGEFLYRTARVKKLINDDIQDVSQRPYPGGGAIYELELYLTINECVNIQPGMYHYDPAFHRLYKISELNLNTINLLKGAAHSAGMEKNPPQVLITITARFQRLSWKYESMAYNVILKNVGVLYQTMYLVATAMDLSPCALGGGDSDLFAKTAGLNYYEETSVGEFLLGSKRI